MILIVAVWPVDQPPLRFLEILGEMMGGNSAKQAFPVFLEDSQFPYDSNAPTQLQLFGYNEFPAACNADPAKYIGTDTISALNQPSKRCKEAIDNPMQHNLQISLSNFYQDEADRSGTLANPNAVSTGLRLSYDDDEHKSCVTSSSGTLPLLPIMSLGDSLRTEAERQKEEFDYYIRIQEEQLAKGVKEMKQRHMASLLRSTEKEVSRRIQEKTFEHERLNRRNEELAEQIKLVGMEILSWQYRAQCSESMVDALRSNIMQSAAPGQAKEGCGDSEVDNTASSYRPDALLAPAGGGGAWTMACRVCRSKEVCMLLLPCRHLCLCKDCDGFVDACPICLSLKTASVEVYMS